MRLLLPLILLLGCATPGAQMHAEGLVVTTAVPFADGRVLGLDINHHHVWLDEPPKGDLRALGFTPASPGEDVLLRTRTGAIWAHILHTEGADVLFVTQDPIAPGMSGAGLWRGKWLVGILTARDPAYHTLGEARLPFLLTPEVPRP